VQKYPGIRAIAFNGKASERLFTKYFGSIEGIELYPMPSTSPANAGIVWEKKVGEWGKIKEYLND
jgi:G:T/U-mismatch repair DNA glycosylase